MLLFIGSQGKASLVLVCVIADLFSMESQGQKLLVTSKLYW